MAQKTRQHIPKTHSGATVHIPPGDYETASLDGESWGHTEELYTTMKPIDGIALFEVWEGAYLWDVLIFEGGQTEAEEGKPIVIIVPSHLL